MERKSATAGRPAPTISLIRGDQIPAAVELFDIQLKEHQVETNPTVLLKIIEEIVADFRRGFILVAASGDGKLVGVAFGSAFLGMEHGGESGYLEELYVLPEWRQQGIGARLISEAIAVARKRGWRALDLEVEADHHRVIRLYARHNFKAVSRSRFCLKLD